MENKKFNEETLTASVKKKNILLAIEYCLENKIEFVVSSAGNNDDFLIGFVIKDLATAVALGMSLKDLKVDVQNIPSFISPNAIKSTKKAPATSNGKTEHHEEAQAEMPTLENTLKFDMEAAN
jgi:hypothetical protein